MSKQEAMQIADDLESEVVTGRVSNFTGRRAANELRRLHASNAQLLEALQAQWHKKNLLGYVAVLEDAASAIRALKDEAL